MLDNAETKVIYSKIQKQLFYMIPEKWDKIYLYASVKETINQLETGELFFYYFPKGILRKNPVNSYEIPYKFNLEEESYNQFIEDLYGLVKQLRECFRKEEEQLWTSLTIKVENFHFIIEFCYDKCDREEEKQHLIWMYKNLGIPLESYTKKERQIILQYLEEEKINPPKIQVYTEPMYRNQIRNVVQYNCERVQFKAPAREKETVRKVTKRKAKEELRQKDIKDKTEKELDQSDINGKSKRGLSLKAKRELKQKVAKRETKRRLISKSVAVENQIELSLEQQIEQQRSAVRSQILSH